jgi:hypothetical protein
MNPSVTEPISQAFERTRRILFQPFDLGKWCLLGFCAFLAQLGEGGGGSSFQFPGGGPGAPGPPGPPGVPPASPFAQALTWLQANWTWVVPVAALALAALIAIVALLTWLSARGRFMLLDGIVRNRGAIAEPWREQRAEANRFFVARLLLTLLGGAAMLLAVGVALALAWTDLMDGRLRGGGVAALVVGITLMLLMALALGLASWLLDTFVLPAMYLRRAGVRDAWDAVRYEILRGHVGTVVLFLLMQIVLSIGAGMIGIVVICATCCLAALPYVSSVVLLPIAVFMRCYGLCFMEQFGPQWTFFVRQDEPPVCHVCGYDLRMNVSGVCPECGTPAVPSAIPPSPPV